MVGFETLVYNMNRMGFFQFLFPFLLVLAIVYGVLSYSLKEQLPNSARGLISIIVAFFFMLYASANKWIVDAFSTFAGGTGIIGSGILVLVIFLGLFGIQPKSVVEGKAKWIVVLALVIIAIAIFLGAAGSMVSAVNISSDFYTILFFIVVLVIAVWWLGSGEGGGKGEGG